VSKGRHDAGSRHIRMLFNVGTVGDLTDGQLLRRFTTHQGETAEPAVLLKVMPTNERLALDGGSEHGNPIDRIESREAESGVYGKEDAPSQ
jgi:hypothetical protein